MVSPTQAYEFTELSTPSSPHVSLRVIRRNGAITSYDDSKIAIAMMKAFLAVEGRAAAESSRVRERVEGLRNQITEKFVRRRNPGDLIHIEDIQDQVELALMASGEHKIARAYVLYREEHRKQRESQGPEEAKLSIHVSRGKGDRVPLDLGMLRALLARACHLLPATSPQMLLEETLRNLYDGIPESEVIRALILTARTRIETEPQYSGVAARLLHESLKLEALGFFGCPTSMGQDTLYSEIFPLFIERGIALGRLDPRMASFNIPQLADVLVFDRDDQFSYLGLQTLYDRYFLHHDGQRFELPQAFFMRVAMGLAIEERDKNARAIEFYHLISSFDFMCSTPTLFNSGTTRPQLSSCFLTTVPDDLEGIYGAIRDNALLSKFAGGLGNDWTPVRAINAHIQGTNGKSQGVVPFLKVANDTAVAVNQGGKRKGAVCAYLETWHLDIEEFLELRKNTGDERRRTHDMNTANWVPDLFMRRVEEQADWTLFSPDETPDLHDRYGKDFEEAYIAYERQADAGSIKNFKRLPALKLWRKMLSMLFETGHPWITFKDPCNLRSPQQHCGVVHSSNLCTEITLNTSEDEIAVCNLGSINLARHLRDGGLDTEKLSQTIRTAVRMLDNVIDINYYTVPQAKHSNLRHRPIGLGVMGFQDVLHALKIPYASEAAVEMADRSMEVISYYALDASAELAQERGSYATFEGSLWHRGILPIDSIALLAEHRQADELLQDQHSHLDWAPLREKIRNGMRHSNVMAIAPTATISNICGVSQSIEPTYQNLFVKSNLSGEFTVVNPYLVEDLKALGLWDEVMIHDLKYYNGSVAQITRIPESLRTLYATVFEIPISYLLRSASMRQKWIDQAQSLNLYMAEPSGKKLDQCYREAWRLGLKTTYYLRTLGASSTEKSTLQTSELNAVTSNTVCDLSDPTCESCQ